MSFGDEAYSSIYVDKSIDSKKLNNTINIEVNGGTRNPIETGQNSQNNGIYEEMQNDPHYAEVDISKNHGQTKKPSEPIYAAVDMQKKRDALKSSNSYVHDDIYEEVEVKNAIKKTGISSEYELVITKKILITSKQLK